MVSVSDIIGGAFRLLRQRIGAVAIWFLLYLAMTVALQFFLRPVMHDMFLSAPVSAPPDFSRLMSQMSSLFGVYVLMLIVMLIIYTAALRSILRPEDSSFAYLRLGMDELRMLLLGVVFFVSFMLLYMLLAVLVALVVGVISVASRDAVLPVVILSVIAIFGVLTFFYVRFSLAFPLTMLRRRVVVGEAWSLSSARFWTLFGAYFVLTLIVMVGLIAVTTLNSGSYFAELSQARLAPGAVQALQRQQMERQFGAVTGLTVFGWVLAALVGTVWVVTGAGATGTAAAGLLDDRFADVGAIYE